MFWGTHLAGLFDVVGNCNILLAEGDVNTGAVLHIVLWTVAAMHRRPGVADGLARRPLPSQ